MTCVCGKPCSRTSGGPSPFERAKMRPTSVSIQWRFETGEEIVAHGSRSRVMRAVTPLNLGERGCHPCLVTDEGAPLLALDGAPADVARQKPSGQSMFDTAS